MVSNLFYDRLFYTYFVVDFDWLMFSKKNLQHCFFSALIIGVLIMMSNSKRNEYFYVVLDGTMILQGILLLIAMYFKSTFFSNKKLITVSSLSINFKKHIY